LSYAKLVDSFTDFITELLEAFKENINVEIVIDRLSEKREEINNIHKEILKNNEEYKEGLRALDVQAGQAREFLEAEFGKPEQMEVNPYEVLKQYYKVTIDELKRQIISFQGTTKKGAALKRFLTIERTKEETENLKPTKELDKALENFHTMVHSFYHT